MTLYSSIGINRTLSTVGQGDLKPGGDLTPIEKKVLNLPICLNIPSRDFHNRLN